MKLYLIYLLGGLVFSGLLFCVDAMLFPLTATIERNMAYMALSMAAMALSNKQED